jgi:hypothetical protein
MFQDAALGVDRSFGLLTGRGEQSDLSLTGLAGPRGTLGRFPEHPWMYTLMERCYCSPAI